MSEHWKKIYVQNQQLDLNTFAPTLFVPETNFPQVLVQAHYKIQTSFQTAVRYKYVVFKIPFSEINGSGKLNEKIRRVVHISVVGRCLVLLFIRGNMVQS